MPVSMLKGVPPGILQIKRKFNPQHGPVKRLKISLLSDPASIHETAYAGLMPGRIFSTGGAESFMITGNNTNHSFQEFRFGNNPRCRQPASH